MKQTVCPFQHFARYYPIDRTHEHIDRWCDDTFTTYFTTIMRFYVFFTALFSTIVADLIPFRVQYHDELQTISDIKVPVRLGVMSRCPDALLCESTFNEVLKKVIDKVDLSLVYIAK